MKQRLFIALSSSGDLQREITDLQSRLEKLGLPLRFEPAEKLHLTLNFIGAIDKTETEKISGLIKDVASEFSSFSLTPAFLETLYQKHGTSLVYLGLSGDVPVLKNLQSELKKGLSGIHLPQPDRFLPHITIGGFKKADPVLTKSFMDTVREFDFSPLSGFTVDRITLYESLLSKEGSHYRRLRQFSLSSDV